MGISAIDNRRTAAPSWRSEPAYEGFCSDGYYQTADGRLHYRPPADPVAARRRLTALLDSIPAWQEAAANTGTAGIHPVALRSGRMPSGNQVEQIRQAVWSVPHALVGAWLARGGRMEVISGCNAAVHPQYPRANADCLGWHRRGGFIVVAADHHDAAQTARHELGHSIDETLNYPSRSPEWQAIWQHDLAVSGRIRAPFRAEPFEWFAEAVALYCCGAYDDGFQTEADRFIGRLAFQYCQ